MRGEAGPRTDRARQFPVWYRLTDAVEGHGAVAADVLVAVVTGNAMPHESLVRRVAERVADQVMRRGLTPGPEAWQAIETCCRAECVAAGVSVSAPRGLRV